MAAFKYGRGGYSGILVPRRACFLLEFVFLGRGWWGVEVCAAFNSMLC